MKKQTRQTWTIEEAAELIGVGRSTAYAAARSGQIPVIRVGRRLLVTRAGLDALLSAPAVNRDALAAPVGAA